MERIAIRELRNNASRVVRRARAGEHIVITVDGVPVAQIGPLSSEPGGPSLKALIAQGRLLPPRSTEPPVAASPVRLGGQSSLEVLNRLRDR